MLRNILTSINLVFFVAAGLIMIFIGDSGTRTVGFVSVFFFGGLGGLALLGTRRRQGRAAKQKNSQVLAREKMLASVAHMNGQIHCLSPFYFDIRGPAASADVLIQEWVARQKPERFDTFLEVIAEPPPEADELWRISVSHLLSAWVLSDADHLLDKISRIVSVEAARPVLLETFASISEAAGIQEVPKLREQMALWLKPWQAQGEALPEMEREWLETAATFCTPAC